MDERIQAFLRAVVDLEGNFHAEVREGVRICLADYERKFPGIPRASYRERVVEEIARQKGTPTEHHLRIVLGAIDDSRGFHLRVNKDGLIAFARRGIPKQLGRPAADSMS